MFKVNVLHEIDYIYGYIRNAVTNMRNSVTGVEKVIPQAPAHILVQLKAYRDHLWEMERSLRAIESGLATMHDGLRAAQTVGS